jgi:hypothetical protein
MEIVSMNVTIGVYVMLFGGVVFTEPATAPRQPFPQPAAAPSRDGFDLPAARPEAYGGRGHSAYGQGGRGVQPVSPERMMPTAPTDFGNRQGDDSAALPFMSPTDQPGALRGSPTGNFSDQPNAGNPFGQQPDMGLPGMPRRYSQPTTSSRRPSYGSRRTSRYGRRQSPRSYAEHRIQQTQFSPMGSIGFEAGGSSSRGVSGSGSKPFTDYSQRPAVSPYMNMFRGGGVEASGNYNSYVKPRLNQGQKNSMVGGQIRSLQSSSRYQGSALQSLGSQTRTLQGRGTHSYFMNRQGYFGGGK